MNTKTIFHNIPRTTPIESVTEIPDEKEIILSPGTQVITIPAADNTMMAYVVASPRFQHDHYWPGHALRYAYDKYLNIEYSDKSYTETIGNKIVHRPDHGLAHTYRVMEYIPMVIEYLATYAKDEDFRNFCERMVGDGANYLRIAAAFTVTGRESEIGFKNNEEKYNEYRQASVKHFREYVESELPKEEIKSEEVDRLADVLRYMGHPNYTTKINVADQTDISKDENYKKRNYLYTLLSMAHKLDLPRVYGEKEYKRAISFFDDSVIKCSEQREALNLIQKYAIELIRKQGDSLCCQFNEQGELINKQKFRGSHFGNVSHSIRALEDKTKTVTIPTFRGNLSLATKTQVTPS